MNFRPNIPEYHDVNYIQTDSPSVSSSVSSPTIGALDMPQAMWSLHRSTFQPSSTTHPIYPHLPPSPSFMGYQPSPTLSSYYSPTSQSSDYYHPLSATPSYVSNSTTTSTVSNASVNNTNTNTTTTTTTNNNNNNTNSTFYANSHSIYTYPPQNYYNINNRENQYIIEPPLVPIPTQSRSLPLPVQQQQQQQYQRQREQQQQYYQQQQIQFQAQMQNQAYFTQSIVRAPQTQSVKQGLLSLRSNIKKRKYETQIKGVNEDEKEEVMNKKQKKEDKKEEEKVSGKILKRQRSASTSAATTATTTGTIASFVASTSTSTTSTTTFTNVISTNSQPTTNLKNKKLKKMTKKKKKITVTTASDAVTTAAPSTSPDVTPVPSPLPSKSTFQDDNKNVVIQLENELSFLSDECATILMMLDSLRNAYLADGPNQSIGSPPPGSISTATEEGGRRGEPLFVHESTLSPIHIEEKRRSNDIAQNRDIEREMRIAYDDLMLQVRQVERKIAKLERKSQMITTQHSTQPSVTKENKQDQQNEKKKKVKK